MNFFKHFNAILFFADHTSHNLGVFNVKNKGYIYEGGLIFGSLYWEFRCMSFGKVHLTTKTTISRIMFECSHHCRHHCNFAFPCNSILKSVGISAIVNLSSEKFVCYKS